MDVLMVHGCPCHWHILVLAVPKVSTSSCLKLSTWSWGTLITWRATDGWTWTEPVQNDAKCIGKWCDFTHTDRISRHCVLFREVSKCVVWKMFFWGWATPPSYLEHLYFVFCVRIKSMYLWFLGFLAFLDLVICTVMKCHEDMQDIHSRPAVTEKKSLKDLPGLSRDRWKWWESGWWRWDDLRWCESILIVLCFFAKMIWLKFFPKKCVALQLWFRLWLTVTEPWGRWQCTLAVEHIIKTY